MIRIFIIILCLNLVKSHEKLQDSDENIIDELENNEVESTQFEISMETREKMQQLQRELDEKFGRRWKYEEFAPPKRYIIIPIGAICALIGAIVRCALKERDPDSSVLKDDDELSIEA